MAGRLTRVANLVLAGLAVMPVAITLLAAPAGAHEWFLWHRALPYPYAGRDPSDPGAGLSTPRYHAVTRELRSYRPVDPLPWGDVNKRVTPIPKPPPETEKKQ